MDVQFQSMGWIDGLSLEIHPEFVHYPSGRPVLGLIDADDLLQLEIAKSMIEGDAGTFGC